jgi:hypothetical protein
LLIVVGNTATIFGFNFFPFSNVFISSFLENFWALTKDDFFSADFDSGKTVDGVD